MRRLYLKSSFGKPRPVSIAFAAAFFAICSITWLLCTNRQLRKSERDLAGMNIMMHFAEAIPRSGQRQATSFVKNLPDYIPVDPIISNLQRASIENSVSFVSIETSNHKASAQSLGRVRLQIMLRGSYSNIKEVISDMFNRYPGILLEHLNLKRMVSRADLEARVGLLLIIQPMPEAGVEK